MLPDAAFTEAGRSSKTELDSASPKADVSIVSAVMAQLAPKVVVIPSTTSVPLIRSPVDSLNT